MRLALLIDPKCTEAFYTKPVEPFKKWEGHPLLNWAQVYRALLLKTSITYWEIMRPSPTSLTPNLQSPTTPYQCSLLRNEETSPAYLLQVYRALLHQTSRTSRQIRRPSASNWLQVFRALLQQSGIKYWEIHTYPVQTNPPNQAQMYIALLHQRGPPLIELNCTESYYTKPV